VHWILWAILGAGILHVLEEYAWPGGFIRSMRRLVPPVAAAATPRVAIAINGLMFIGYVAAALLGARAPAFSLSAAALGFWNAMFHVGGSVRSRGYAPGTATGLLLYVPLAAYAYLAFSQAGLLSAATFVVSFATGLLYHAIPIGYFLVTYLVRKRRRHRSTARLWPDIRASHDNTGGDI
jgi:hypothetical protein